VTDATIWITAGNDDGHEAADGTVVLAAPVVTAGNTAEGVWATKWGTYGAGDGQFVYPYGVAVADGSVYVTDFGNHRVQKFTSSGTFVAKWGSVGGGDGQFSYPYGVAVAADGSVYVADRGNHRVQKFDASGTFLAKWGSSGTGDGQFSAPTGVAVASDGSVYVADRNNNRIQKFASPAAGRQAVAGLRLVAVPLGPGATVSAAYLRIVPTAATAAAPKLTIRGEINPAAFTTADGELSGRTMTAAEVEWDAGNVWAGAGVVVGSPDISAVIQEIIDDGAWAEEGEIGLYLIDSGEGGGLTFLPYDYGPGTSPPALILEWVSGAPSTELSFAWPYDYWPEGYWAEYWPDIGEAPPATGAAVKFVFYARQRRRL